MGERVKAEEQVPESPAGPEPRRPEHQYGPFLKVAWSSGSLSALPMLILYITGMCQQEGFLIGRDKAAPERRRISAAKHAIQMTVDAGRSYVWAPSVELPCAGHVDSFSNCKFARHPHPQPVCPGHSRLKCSQHACERWKGTICRERLCLSWLFASNPGC
jgi:hypothetical protein